MRRARLPRFRERTGAVFVALVLSAPACSDDARAPAATPLGVPAAQVACTTLSDDCALPLPSNLFARPADTATGLALDLHAETFTSPATSEMMRCYPPATFATMDGFSALAPVMVPLPTLPDPSSLPSDAAASVTQDASVRVWDVESGAPLAFTAILDARAAAKIPPRAILSLVPQRPFAPGHTVVALVTDRVRTLDGAPMPRFVGFAAIADGGSPSTADAALERVRTAMQPVLAMIASDLGEDPEHVVTATAFTVRSHEPTTRSMRALAAAIAERARTHPPRFRVSQVVPPLPALETKGVAAGVIGHMTAPDYRDANHRIVWDERGRPVEQREHWLEVVLKLPKTGSGRAPVVVFGHGFGAFKETLLQISSAVGQRGYATIGIDLPGHGSRLGEDGVINDDLTPERLLQGRDDFLQGIADELQLARLVEGELATLDVWPEGGDGVPDLAPSAVAYVGQSLGSTLGGVLIAVEPSMGAAVLNVPGAGLVSLFQLGPALESLLDGMLPANATPTDRLALVPLLQLLFDDVDPGNFAAHVIDDPFSRRRAKDVLLQQAMDDADVPATATALFANALGVPQVLPSLEPVFGLETVSAPALGSGLYQFHVSNTPSLNHLLALSRPGALRQVADFIDSHARTGRARIETE